MKKTNSCCIKLFFCSYMFFLSSQIYAASFDCIKASSTVENMVCSDNELSALDNTLSKLFNTKKDSNKNITTSQKEWLRDERNMCKTEECLKSVYTKRIEYLKRLEYCPVDRLAIIGGWVRVKGEGFEEMKFSADGGIQTFLSWIHHRPEMTGFWKFEECTIHIKDSNEENIQFDLKVKKLDKDKLFVLDTDGGAEAIYKKVFSRQQKIDRSASH